MTQNAISRGEITKSLWFLILFGNETVYEGELHLDTDSTQTLTNFAWYFGSRTQYYV